VDRIRAKNRRNEGSENPARRRRWRPAVIELERRELLSTIVVNNPTDTPVANQTDLRQAIAQANSDGGGDTIVFSSLFNSPHTITLTGGQLELTGTKAATTITCPGANLLSVSGNNASRVFLVDANVSASISGMTITGGNADTDDDNGGGVQVEPDGALTMTDCTVSDNATSGQSGSGGGLVCSPGGTLTMTSCTVSGNKAVAGGGLFNDGGTLSMTNCTVGDNSSTGRGGGLGNFGLLHPATLTLTDCTFSGNSAADGGSGLYNTGGSATLTSTIVAGNGGSDVLGNYTDGGHNLISGNPLLAVLGDYGGPTFTMPPIPGSPAIAGGTTTDAPATDQRGQPRTGRIDIGAFQTQPGIIVNTTGDGVGSAPGELNLRQAVNLANALPTADTITFSSLFNTPQTITLTAGELKLTDKATTTITGPGLKILTISGDGKSGVFDERGGSAAFSGVTISGGLSSFGGGVYNQGGTVTMTDCWVSQNTADDSGGGIANAAGGTLTLNHCTVFQNSALYGASDSRGGGLWNAGTATITDCTISLNESTKGGGLYNDINGALSLTSVNVYDNLAFGGGGLYNNLSKTTLTDCTVTNNGAVPIGGGGLYNSPGGTLSLTGCMVSNNTYLILDGSYNAIGGGGLCSLGTTTLTDCTLSGNSGYQKGGGLFVFAGTTTLTNCTISDNYAGGVYVESGATLTNCTISANYAGGLYIESVATATLTNTIVAAQTSGDDVVGSINGGNNLIGGNPLLGPLGNYGGSTFTMPLLPGSPAIGAGTTAGAPATDQRGLPRVGPVDIGAFQSQGFTLTLVAGSTPQLASSGAPFANPLAVKVTANNPIEPVDGGVINFAAPATGASAALSAATAVITSGQASVTATANDAHGTYSVNATAAGAAPLDFVLTNTGSSMRTREPTPEPTAGPSTQVINGLAGLRAAIAYADSHPGPDTITVDPPVFGKERRTIKLKGGPLILTNPATTTIKDPGARRLLIRGDGKGPIFDIEGGSLALDGVTISGGRSDRGGGIRNKGGRLVLTNVVIRGNRARVGGGLYNDGTALLSDVVFRGNQARIGSGLFSTRRATLTWSRSPARGRG
jgi:parallel beta-helix repeat protein